MSDLMSFKKNMEFLGMPLPSSPSIYGLQPNKAVYQWLAEGDSITITGLSVSNTGTVYSPSGLQNYSLAKDATLVVGPFSGRSKVSIVGATGSINAVVEKAVLGAALNVSSLVTNLPRSNDLWPMSVSPGFSGLTFSATRSGLHSVTITNTAFFAIVLDETCQSIGAYMDGYGAVPVEVRPDATKAGNFAVLYVKVPAAGTVQINISTSLRRNAARTISPYTQPVKNVNLGLSGSHSAATAVNPLTSFVHPSMVYIPGGWNGSAYWMTATPWAGIGYPTADRYEDGLLFNSNDAATWTPVNVNASGFANLTSAFAFNGSDSTDTRLAFDQLGNGGAGILYAFSRLVSTVETMIRMQSTNGTTWTNAAGTTGAFDTLTFSAGALVAHPLAATVVGCLSPSILINNGEWRMWATLQAADSTIYLRLFKSLNGLDWQGGDILQSPWTADYQGAWHTDVQYDTDSRQYVMLGQLQRKSAIGSTYTNVNMLYTSPDGEAWVQHPVPAAYAGQDSTATYHIYKGCLCRTGVRQWIIVNSVSVLSNSTKYLSLAGPLTIEFDRPRYCREACAVFDEPAGRWYGTTANIATGNLIQREPAWSMSGTAGATVNITNGKLTTLRNGAQAAIASSGTRMCLTYRLLLRLRCTHTTATIRIASEAGISLGLHIEGAGSLLRCAQTGDAGVAYTNDTVAHNWELRREQLSPYDANAIVTTGSTNGTRTVAVASSTGFQPGMPVVLVGAGVGGADVVTTISTVPNGVSITVPDNQLTNASIQVRATQWRETIFRDGVSMRVLYFSELLWGKMGVFGSGSADGQGCEIEWMYLLPIDAPDLTIA